MVQTKSQYPAYNKKPVDGINTLVELPWIGKINIRGDISDKKFVAAIDSVLGMSLPQQPHKAEQTNIHTAYWLGPNEWLVYCDIDQTQQLISKLRSQLEGLHSAIVDVSDYYTVLQLEGPDASTLLAKACPMDLHSDVFPNGHCSQTRFGHASIMLHKKSDTPSYDIQVRWSYTEYVWDYLLSALTAIDHN